jgi:alpha-D-xyloside xylohydrolase
MAPHPIVDDLYTRALERRDVDRSSVGTCELLEREAASLLLRTTAKRWRSPRWHVEGDDLGAYLPRDGAEGLLRVEAVSDGVFRIRYAEGDTLPANETPMVVGALPAPGPVSIEEGDGRVVLATAKARVETELFSLRLRVLDAAGRTLTEIGGPEKNHLHVWDSYNTGICRTRDDRPLAVECFSLRPREGVFGFGEQFTALDKVGQTVDLNMVEAMGTTTPRSYKNIPFFWTTGGWGAFLNHSARMTCWVGSRAAADLQVAVEDDFLDYYLFVGEPKEILARYTDLTGKPHMPPRWSFGFWQSKISYQSAEEALEVVRNNRAHGIPTDVLHLDTAWFRENWRCDLEFDPERFPDPAAFMKEMAGLGAKVCLWQLPYIPEGCALFDELAEAGGFVKTASGGIYDVAICYTPGFAGRVGCIDFTNPEAVRIYQKHLRRLFDLGARVIKADFGEQAPLDGVYHDGTPGHRMHNLYPLLYNRFVAEATEAATGEWIMWARSTWAGSQRYPLHWGGDSSANWHNLAPQIAGGLSLGLSGFPFWSMDIGGFFGTAADDLLVRWMQAGALFSHPRIHGTGDRELWKRPPETLARCREALRLHYRLLPYLWATAIDCVETALPVSRALVLEFPDDPTTRGVADQWLVGDALLFAPILDESGRRKVYLPRGGWTDWASGERQEGPRWIDIESDLDALPLWLRDGEVVPLAPVVDFVDQRPLDSLTVRVAPFRGDGERTLRIPTTEGEIDVAYTARGGRHELAVSSGVSASIEVVGSEVAVTLSSRKNVPA